MSVEVGDEVRLNLTLGEDDDYLERVVDMVGEVVDGDVGGEHTHLVAVEIDGETLEVLAADHELELVTEVAP